MDLSKLRVGLGTDVHTLVKGRPCILAGIRIPCEVGPDGHSDADVLTHAVMDALLGAAGKGDIGSRFPPSDTRWKGADSVALLESIWAELKGEGWTLLNIDCSLLAETPRISPYLSAMKERIAVTLSCTPDQIGIKATTSEGLGFVGRREGILAQAVAPLIKI